MAKYQYEPASTRQDTHLTLIFPFAYFKPQYFIMKLEECIHFEPQHLYSQTHWSRRKRKKKLKEWLYYKVTITN